MTWSQGEANWWTFGEFAAIDFNQNPPQPGTRALDTSEGCATISDDCGQLQFYTDGLQAWNINDVVMQNGGGLTGSGSSAQSGIIVPDLDDENIYYLFAVDSGGLTYSVVDMTLDGGLGAIVSGQKNINVQNSTQEKVASVENDAGDGYWIITYDDDTYSAYELVNGTLNPTPVVSVFQNDLTDARGYLKVSPNGQYISNASVDGSEMQGVIAEFDDATGVVSNEIQLEETEPEVNSVYCMEFSPDSNFLYADLNSNASGNANTQNNSKALLQYDLTNGINPADFNPAQYEVIYFQSSGSPDRAALQIAPNGKIYWARPGQPWLAEIGKPNEPARAVDFEWDGIQLASGTSSNEGLPPFVASIFELEITAFDAGTTASATQFCNVATVDFDLDTNYNCPGGVQVIWDFGDGTNSNLEDPSHTYPGPGFYEVNVTVIAGTAVVSSDLQIVVYPSPVIDPPNDLVVCDDPTNDGVATFDLTSNNDVILPPSSNQPNMEITYHNSLADAENDVNRIVSPDIYEGQNGEEIFVRVDYILAEDDNFNCFDATESFFLIVNETPQVGQVADQEFCDDDGSRDQLYSVDLTQYDATILDGQDPSLNTVTYHLDQNDAEDGINELPNPNDFSTGTTTVFAGVENNSTGCRNVTSFNITIYDVPELGIPMDLEFCEDLPIDQLTVVDLRSEQDANILDGRSDADFSVNYYPTQADAQNQTNAYAPVVDLGTTTVFYRVNDLSNGCFSIGSFDIVVLEIPTIGEVMDLSVCDDAPLDGSAIVALVDQDAAALDGQDPTQFIVEYYTSLSDAENGVNALPDNANLSSGTVYYTVENLTNGCFRLGQFNVSIDFCDVEIPEAFSPNGDGVNDTFQLVNVLQYPEFNLKIFNRNGAVIYETSGSNYEEFAGIPNTGIAAGDSLLPVGTYFYVIQFNDERVEDVANWVYINY